MISELVGKWKSTLSTWPVIFAIYTSLLVHSVSRADASCVCALKGRSCSWKFARATCPNVFIVKALRGSELFTRARKRIAKPIKLQLYPAIRRAATKLSSREILATCYSVPVARTANRLCKVSPLQAGHEFATRQRDEYETDCFTIPTTNAPFSPLSRVSVYTYLKSHALPLHPLRCICVSKPASLYKSTSLENSWPPLLHVVSIRTRRAGSLFVSFLSFFFTFSERKILHL